MIFISFMTFFISTNNSYATSIPRDWLVWEWLLDWNANDTSGNWYNGTVYWTSYSSWLNNSLSMYFENSNNAGYYDKKDYVTLPNISLNNFSVSLWTKFKLANNFDYNAALFSIWDWTNWPFFWIKTDTRNWNLLAWFYYNWSTYESWNYSINDESWHHITVTKSQNEMKLYIDNRLKDTINIPNIIFSNEPAYISYHQWFWWTAWSSRYYWYIDNIRIYNSVITEDNRIALWYELMSPSCFDWIKNQNETSIDLWWICWSISRDSIIWEWLLDWNTNDSSWRWITLSNHWLSTFSYNRFWNSNNWVIFLNWNQYLRSNTNIITNRSSYSAELWFKINEYPDNSDALLLWLCTNSWPNTNFMIMYSHNTRWTWYVLNITRSKNYVMWYNNPYPIDLILGKRYHFVYTFDWTNHKWFLDWINIMSQVNSFWTWVWWENYIVIWWLEDNNLWQSKSTIDDVRIYNRVLTDSEIQALYNEWTPSSSASWRWSCVEQKSATNFWASIVNVNWKNAIKVNWQNPDWSTTTKVTKNYAQDIDIQSWNNEYLDYDIEIWKTYTYYIKSINNCWNFGTTEKIEITYDNKPKFSLVDLNSANNSLSLFLTKYWNFWTDNIRVWWYLTSNDWFNTRFQPRINEQYNYWYIKAWDYHLVLQVEDMNWNTYANFKIEKDIKITQTSSAKMDFALSADDSWPDYINYKYSLTTKYFNFKNANAKLSLIDAVTKNVIKEEKFSLTSDNNWITSDTFLFKELYLSSNKTYKRMLKLTIWDSGEAIYSNVYDFKVWWLNNFELSYNSWSKIFSWERQNNPSLVYNFLCRSNDWWTNISKTLNNTLSYKDSSKNLIENWNYSCFVNYFNNWYIYKSNEIIFWTDLSLTRRWAYEVFMKIYNNWASIDYDKEALRLWIINNTSEKWNKVKWLEYANILFKIYWNKVFSDKSYDKATYDEFSKLLVNLIWIEDWWITKDEFNDLKQYLSENNDRFKTRVQNVFNYKDEILQYIKKWRTQSQLDYLKKIIKNYFSINY